MLNVLVVEDLPAFQEMYTELLEQLGCTSSVAASIDRARELLGLQRFDAVLLDQRLQGPDGPDDGITLLQSAQLKGAKVFLITAYASDEMIKRAFELGAFDYIEKGPRLAALLAAKLEQVRELVRATSRQLPDADRRIRDLWAHLDVGTAQGRGKRLEDLVLMIMTSVPGFQTGWKNLRTPGEELDVVIRNESPDPFWQKQPPYVLAECKNWSKVVGTHEIGWVIEKMRNRPDARLAFFFAVRGFSEPVEEQLRIYRASGLLIVPVGRPDLEALVHGPDRDAKLKELHVRYAVGQ